MVCAWRPLLSTPLSAERCSGIIWVRSKKLKFTCDALDNFISLQLSGVSEHIIITASPHTILISGSCSCPIGFRTNRHNGDQLSWHSPIVLFGSYMKSCLRKHFIDPLMLMFLASMSRDGACRMKNGSYKCCSSSLQVGLFLLTSSILRT